MVVVPLDVRPAAHTPNWRRYPGMGSQGNIGPMNQYVPEFWAATSLTVKRLANLIPCNHTPDCAAMAAPAVKFGTRRLN